MEEMGRRGRKWIETCKKRKEGKDIKDEEQLKITISDEEGEEEGEDFGEI